jgi:FkbM family methyltransferase
LPNPKYVKKINCAVSPDGSTKMTKIFYVPLDIINENNLPNYVRGCNTIENFHPVHEQQNLKHLVVQDEVTMKPLCDIFKENKVRSVSILKLDTEGCDCKILQNFSNYLKLHEAQKDLYWPKKIIFETNSLTDDQLINNTIALYEQLGYKSQRNHEDTELTL